MSAIKVLVVGTGGREHALARALSADPQVVEVHCAPGNPGTEQVARNHPVDANSGDAVAALATELGVNLVVVGPEAPLVAGVADAVRAAGIACFGPSAQAAQLEGSKAFAKEVMSQAGVPTAESLYCTNADEVAVALDRFGAPYVVKDDGLAAGKGVIVTSDRQAALDHARDCGRPVIVEEYLDGPEVSLFAICDGERALPMQPAQDFKRVGDGDAGPNTGGMGAYTPLPWADPGLVNDVMESVVNPTLRQMATRRTPFQGVLYVGLALTSRGLRVVEFNVRFGDPETQPLLARLTSPLGQVLLAAANGDVSDFADLSWRDESAVIVVMAAQGYPGTPAKGGTVRGPRVDGTADSVHIIHAGTARNNDGELVAAGGRVLGVVGTGTNLGQARQRVYDAIDELDFPDGFCRRDIAAKAAEESS